MQEMEEQEANTKLVQGLSSFQTKYLQDMEEQEANTKLVLGTITFLNQMKNFPPKQILAGHG